MTLDEAHVPVGDRVLLIEGIAAPSALSKVRGGLPNELGENDRAVFAAFAYADIPLGKTYECWFWEDELERVEHATTIVQAATQEMGKPFDSLPHGWRTIAVLRFPQGVPPIVAELPTVTQWYEGERFLLLGSTDAYEARLAAR